MEERNMEKRIKARLREKVKVSHICLLLLALLQIITPSSAQNALRAVSPASTTTTAISTTMTAISTTTTAIGTTTTSAPNPAPLIYRTHPADITVVVGEPAVFLCGVPKTSPKLTFTFYGSHGNYSLTCPHGHMEDVTQALYGSCVMKEDQSLAVWTLKGTSFSDNGTRVICQQSNNPAAAAAVLHVHDNGLSFAVLIGCVIGGFFGILLVFGLSYTMLQSSGTLQRWFRGKETEEDDMTTIVTKD